MNGNIEEIAFDENGLIPAIIQDEQSGKVLMLAYMNQESLNKTIETKETWFYSRSRQELWHKGATSGNKQEVKNISLDCDGDTLLIEVKALGPACHTGAETCFNKAVINQEQSHQFIIHELAKEIQHRKENPIEGSYTSYLFREGIDKVLKKVGEESSEVIIGAKNNDADELTNELADLLYHTLVLMNIQDISITDVKDVLVKRNK